VGHISPWELIRSQQDSPILKNDAKKRKEIPAAVTLPATAALTLLTEGNKRCELLES